MAQPYYKTLAPLVDWKRLPRPIDWHGLFGRKAPVMLELGCGNGELLVRRACEEPEVDFVGVDIGWGSVKRTLRRVAKAGVGNVRVVLGPAEQVVLRLFRPREIAHAWSAFPCPWPKERHEHRRLFSRAFLTLLANRLADGACCVVVTDHEPFAEWILQQAKGSGLEPTLTRGGPGLGTKYERKWLAMGRREFFWVELAKSFHPQLAPYQEPQMRQIVIPEAEIDRLEEFSLTRGEISIRSGDVIYDRPKSRALVHMVAVEQGWVQHFYAEVVRTHRGWVVRVGKGSPVVPTRAVALALEELARRLKPS